MDGRDLMQRNSTAHNEAQSSIPKIEKRKRKRFSFG